MTNKQISPASFRDPSGFVFSDAAGILHRQVNQSYARVYRRLLESGLYDKLVMNGLLIDHQEVWIENRCTDEACAVLRPRALPFVSYPYEWCFGQLKEAALITLAVQQRALDHGMSLKDCSAYNVQFEGTTPIFIDTLSFEEYREGHPWIAYGQFCRHFLAPLALMAMADARLDKLLQLYVDGVPLDLAVHLLPWLSRCRPGLLMHLHMHARALKKYTEAAVQAPTGSKADSAKGKRMSLLALRSLVDSLESTIRKLSCPRPATSWTDYYASNTYSDETTEHKQRLVVEYLDQIQPKMLWDLGANTGVYSRLAARKTNSVVAYDMDWACVELNFRTCKESGARNVLPLCVDLTNPSPGIGWANQERQSLLRRGPVDVVLALALVHHLAIGNNVPLPDVAAFLRQMARAAIVEFVPKEDPQVQRLLASREDMFPDYCAPGFESAFALEFQIVDSHALPNSKRTVYLMEGCR